MDNDSSPPRHHAKPARQDLESILPAFHPEVPVGEESAWSRQLDLHWPASLTVDDALFEGEVLSTHDSAKELQVRFPCPGPDHAQVHRPIIDAGPRAGNEVPAQRSLVPKKNRKNRLSQLFSRKLAANLEKVFTAPLPLLLRGEAKKRQQTVDIGTRRHEEVAEEGPSPQGIVASGNVGGESERRGLNDDLWAGLTLGMIKDPIQRGSARSRQRQGQRLFQIEWNPEAPRQVVPGSSRHEGHGGRGLSLDEPFGGGVDGSISP